MTSYPLSIGPGQSGLRRESAGYPLASDRTPQPARNVANDPRRNLALGALAVTAIASFNLFYRLGEAAHPIWDESYYLTSTARYELRYASFASHPPLGLMLIAAGNHASGANAGVDWAKIAIDKKIAGERMPSDFSYWSVRCASALFGVLATLLIFLLAVELTGSVTTGLIAGSPFLFDTALIAQFRAAQLDSFQLCFAAAALLCLVRGDRSRRLWWTLGFGVACGLATMVRANGLLLVAGIMLPTLRALCLPAAWPRRLANGGRHIAVALVGMALTVAGVLLAHLAVASRPMPESWAAARADAPYVSPAYGSFLAGRSSLSPATAFQAVDGYRRFMVADVAGVGLKDANASSPWSWPLGRKAIVYRWDSDGPTTSYVALVPNLAAWAISLAGLIGGVVALGLPRRVARQDDDRPLILTLTVLWLVFMLLDIALAQVRAMYLYHYFIPLVIGWLLAATLLGRLQTSSGTIAALPNVAVAMVLACFIQLAPIALHRPLTDRACQLRTMMNGANVCEHSVGDPAPGRSEG